MKWGIYAAAFIPLVIFSQFISPFHFGKVVIFRSIIEILTVFYLFLIIKNREFIPKSNIIITVFSLFTFIFGVSTAISINPYLSFWGSLERMGGFWSFLHYLVFFLILVSVFRTREDWLRLLGLSVFVGVLSAFYGFGQKTNISFFIGSGNRERIFGTIGNAALFAGYQIVALFTAITLVFSKWISQRYRGFLWVAILINTIAILMTAVRGSMLGMSIGFLLFTFLYTINSKSQIAKKILFALLILGVLFVAFAFAFKKTNFVQNSSYLKRITDFSPSTYTVNTRFWAWHAGLQGWIETPKTILFGWGPENFDVPFSKHFNPKFFQGIGSETLFDRAHNMFVEVLVTMGLFAFLAYVAMFIVSIRLIWRRIIKGPVEDERVIGMGIISLIVAYMIHNSFIFDTAANFVAFFTMLAFATWLTSHSHSNNTDNQSKQADFKQPVIFRMSMGQQVLMFISLLAVIFFVYRTNVIPSKANYATTRAITRSWGGDFDGALAKYKEALSYNVPGKYEYRHRLAQWVLETTSSKKLGDKETAALLYTIQEVQKNVDENKQDYLPFLYISRCYIVLGKSDPASPYNDLALKNSLKALEISPSFVRTYYEVAQGYLNKKDYANAIKYFQIAEKLNPTVGLTNWYLGATFFEMGRVDEGLKEVDQAIKNGYTFNESDTLRLINLYVKSNNYEKISQLYEGLVDQKPDNAQYHASLAAAYAKIGKIDQAVEQARIAAQLDKNFENEARAFVKSIGREF